MNSTAKAPQAPQLAGLRARIPESVLLRHVDSQLVVFDSHGNRYFVLDEVGERIWQRLGELRELAAVYDALLAEFEVEPAVLADELERFVRELEGLGLIDLRRGSASPERRE